MSTAARAHAALAASLLMFAASCAALDREISYQDPKTGEVVVTTVGDEAADQIEASGEGISQVVGGVLGTATGNPVIGAGAAAALAALLGAGASRLRRKKP
jgi:hypothetical protein